LSFHHFVEADIYSRDGGASLSPELQLKNNLQPEKITRAVNGKVENASK
jgi:hypothetical protein